MLNRNVRFHTLYAAYSIRHIVIRKTLAILNALLLILTT